MEGCIIHQHAVWLRSSTTVMEELSNKSSNTGHSSLVWTVAFSPNGKQLASASEDRTVKMWNAGSGAALQTLEGHSDSVRVVAFAPDGKQLASASKHKTVRLWDTDSG